VEFFVPFIVKSSLLSVTAGPETAFFYAVFCAYHYFAPRDSDQEKTLR
jgi:hypothetical protein